jgi:hypothetical protein
MPLAFSFKILTALGVLFVNNPMPHATVAKVTKVSKKISYFASLASFA